MLTTITPLSTKFVAHALMTESIMTWAIRKAKTTAGQTNITLDLCRRLPIPLPPLAEQERIVAEVDRRLSLILGVQTEVDLNLKRSLVLRGAVLRRVFS
jgi:type I restriction enzyme S subunit